MSTRTERTDDGVDIEKSRWTGSFVAWISVLTAVFGFGINFGITQVKSANIENEVRKSSDTITDLRREIYGKFEKLDTTDGSLRQEINRKAEESSQVFAESNLKIGVLAEKVQQANTTIEKLGNSIEKLADQLRRDRDERRLSDR